jgi:hypothetical protein
MNLSVLKLTHPQWSRVLKNLIVPQVVKKFRTFYGNRSFITVFRKARHGVLWIRPTPSHPVSLRSIFNILPSLPNIFYSGFQTKILYEFLFCPMRATFSVHIIILDLMLLIWTGLGQARLFYFLAPDYGAGKFAVPNRLEQSHPTVDSWYVSGNDPGHEYNQLEMLSEQSQCRIPYTYVR